MLNVLLTAYILLMFLARTLYPIVNFVNKTSLNIFSVSPIFRTIRFLKV